MEQEENIENSDVSDRRAGSDTERMPTDDDNSNDFNAERALAANATVNAATTTARKSQQRMKWTKQMNISVIRCYYIATELELNKIGYRTRMHELFQNENPNINVSEQRVADQRRTIITRKLLTETDLNMIRNNIDKDINGTQTQAHPNEHAVNNIEEQDEIVIEQRTNQNIKQQIKEELDTLLVKYKGNDPTARPKIPKQNSSIRLAKITQEMNTILPEYIENVQSFEDLHDIIFCAALTCAKINGAKIKENLTNKNEGQKKTTLPNWRRRLEKRIENLRTKVNKLTSYKQGHRSERLKNEVSKIKREYKVHTKHEEDNNTIEEFLDTLKQKLSALAKRLKRYIKCSNRKYENKTFKNQEGLFYRNLKENVNINNSPTTEEISNYWSDLWSKDLKHNEEAEWIAEEERRMQTKEPMEFLQFSEAEVTTIINNSHNWKAPGIDGLCTNVSLALIKYSRNISIYS